MPPRCLHFRGLTRPYRPSELRFRRSRRDSFAEEADDGCGPAAVEALETAGLLLLFTAVDAVDPAEREGRDGLRKSLRHPILDILPIRDGDVGHLVAADLGQDFRDACERHCGAVGKGADFVFVAVLGQNRCLCPGDVVTCGRAGLAGPDRNADAHLMGALAEDVGDRAFREDEA